jgi:hypothetical protein
MSTTIHFNTGRRYTANGQRITATLHDDGVVTFWDHDRSVHGEYTEVLPEFWDRTSVMNAYDARDGYKNTSRAWSDGMMRGGVNSKYEGK